MTKHRVVIVVDRTLGSRLAVLASDRHVWIVESPVNSPAVRQVWDGPVPGDEEDPLGPGVTSFAASDAETPEAMCTRIAEDVAEHHSGASHDPPWAEIEVIGVQLSPRLRQVFENIGGTAFQQTADGFVCRR